MSMFGFFSRYCLHIVSLSRSHLPACRCLYADTAHRRVVGPDLGKEVLLHYLEAKVA
jgi:hypothetical protein